MSIFIMEETRKAVIKTKYSEITIESDKDTISNIVLDLQRREEFKERFKANREEFINKETKKNAPQGATSIILQLKSEGFFKTKKALGEVQAELEKKGHIYPTTSLSPLLLLLVKRGELGRLRDNNNNNWVYVHR